MNNFQDLLSRDTVPYTLIRWLPPRTKKHSHSRFSSGGYGCFLLEPGSSLQKLSMFIIVAIFCTYLILYKEQMRYVC